MANLIWSRVDGDRGAQITVIFGDGNTHNIADSHPSFREISVELATADEGYEDRVRELIDPSAAITRRFKNLTERVTTDGHHVYFDGDPIRNALSEALIRIIRFENGEESANVRDVTSSAFVKFLEKLYANPNVGSRNSLDEFISRYGLTIQPDGNFVAYKGVDNELKSIHHGPGVVNGVELSGGLSNEPGNRISIPRSQVEANTAYGCAFGLHAGTLAYASNWGPRVVAVSINPRNVVSVPDDCTFQKIRVCEYDVLLEIDTETENRATRGEDSAVLWTDGAEDEVESEFSVGDHLLVDYTTLAGDSRIFQGTVDSVAEDSITLALDEGGFRTLHIGGINDFTAVEDEDSTESDEDGEEVVDEGGDFEDVVDAAYEDVGERVTLELTDGRTLAGVLEAAGENSLLLATADGYRRYTYDRIVVIERD